MMKGWAKFKPPPNFVQKEEQLKTMDPGEKLSMAYVMEQLDILISKSSGGTKTQYEAIKADLIIEQSKSQFAEGFIEDFILWILGRSSKNIRFEDEEFDPNGRRVIDLRDPKEITPWGNTPYTHLDDVKDFLDQIVDNRMIAMKYIAKLKLRYPEFFPQQSTFLHIKIIQRDDPVDVFGSHGPCQTFDHIRHDPVISFIAIHIIDPVDTFVRPGLILMSL